MEKKNVCRGGPRRPLFKYGDAKNVFSDLMLFPGLYATAASAAKAVSDNEAREIARQAYIFGLPMVTVYSTLYEFSIDKGNPQYKGPFNSILNIAPRVHAGRHRLRHEKFRHTLHLHRAGSSRRADGAVGAGHREEPLFRLPDDGPLHIQFRLHRLAKTRKATGCRRRRRSAAWSCASTGRAMRR